MNTPQMLIWYNNGMSPGNICLNDIRPNRASIKKVTYVIFQGINISSIFHTYPKLIIGWERGFRTWGHLGLGPRCWTGSWGQYQTPEMPESVQDSLWRPGGAFFSD